jgi:hypothetical protein
VVEAQQDVVTALEAGDPGTECIHDASTLMPEDGRQGCRVPLVAHDHVGVADPAGDHPHPHFTGARLVQAELGDGQRLFGRECQHCGDPHGASCASLCGRAGFLRITPLREP